MRAWHVLLVAGVVALLSLLYQGLWGDPRAIPTVLIGTQAPTLSGPEKPVKPFLAGRQENIVSVSALKIGPDLIGGFSLNEPFPYHITHLLGQRRLGFPDGFILADRTAQCLCDRPHLKLDLFLFNRGGKDGRKRDQNQK